MWFCLMLFVWFKGWTMVKNKKTLQDAMLGQFYEDIIRSSIPQDNGNFSVYMQLLRC